jgi:hypothetical protein
MKRQLSTLALTALVAILGTACGGPNGGLPSGDDRGGNDPADPGVTVGAQKSLWPLSRGSTWRYRITDDLRGVFEKHVEALGTTALPDNGGQGLGMKSTQPHLEELSWQSEQDGIVLRLREEDRKEGVLARVMLWSPATVKSISVQRPLDWTHTATVEETTRYPDGTIAEVKEKTYVWRVLAVNETVEVPAGRFEGALRIQRDRPDKTGKERIYWLVRGVGKVREEGERTEELLEYQIK